MVPWILNHGHWEKGHAKGNPPNGPPKWVLAGKWDEIANYSNLMNVRSDPGIFFIFKGLKSDKFNKVRCPRGYEPGEFGTSPDNKFTSPKVNDLKGPSINKGMMNTMNLFKTENKGTYLRACVRQEYPSEWSKLEDADKQILLDCCNGTLKEHPSLASYYYSRDHPIYLTMWGGYKKCPSVYKMFDNGYSEDGKMVDPVKVPGADDSPCKKLRTKICSDPRYVYDRDGFPFTAYCDGIMKDDKGWIQGNMADLDTNMRAWCKTDAGKASKWCACINYKPPDGDATQVEPFCFDPDCMESYPTANGLKRAQNCPNYVNCKQLINVGGNKNSAVSNLYQKMNCGEKNQSTSGGDAGTPGSAGADPDVPVPDTPVPPADTPAAPPADPPAADSPDPSNTDSNISAVIVIVIAIMIIVALVVAGKRLFARQRY